MILANSVKVKPSVWQIEFWMAALLATAALSNLEYLAVD